MIAQIRTNGCLQFMRGSHLMGRVDHVQLTPEQNGIDADIIRVAEQRLQVEYAELEPGDAVFFHCNTFHRSDQNRSLDRRWTLIICYNRAR